VGRIAPTTDDSGFITEAEAEKLLGVLCVKYGFCLPPLWHARLQSCPPKSVAKFTDTVFHAEGLDPDTADRAMYRAMYEEVRLAFERSAQNAAGVTPNTSLERTRER
jgi:hypothetical protein